MSIIITRAGKGSPLLNSEVDANFTNLNADKYQLGSTAVLASMQVQGGTGAQGTMTWNTDELTADLNLGNTTLQMGQEVQMNVRNDTVATIPNGTAVMSNGTIGASGRILVVPMDGSSSSNAQKYLGVTTEDIASGTDGKITYFGKIRNLVTTPYTEGLPLYVDNAVLGGLTTTVPSSGVKIQVGYVVKNHATNGTIMIMSVPLNLNEYEPANANLAKLNVQQTFTKPQRPALQAETAPSTNVITWDLTDDSVYQLNLNANVTTFNLTGTLASLLGYQYQLVVRYNGGTTMSWNAAFKFPGGTAPTLTGTSGKLDIFTFVVGSSDGGTTCYLYNTGKAQNL